MAQALNLTYDQLEAFKLEIDTLSKKARKSIGPSDLWHVRRINLVLRIMYITGLGIAWIFVNPISILLLGLVKSGRWMMLGHAIGHRSYDKISNVPKMYQSKYFAKGWRRYIDWFDWMVPGAWEFEHNVLHHYHTGENSDPDFPQKNIHRLRMLKLPKFIKYLYSFILMATWRFIYYAPNTLYYLELKKRSNDAVNKYLVEQSANPNGFPGSKLYSPFSKEGFNYWKRCLLPYGVYNFVIIPCCFLLISPSACWFVFVNMLFAELFTNIHTFMVVVTNHAGEDVPYFKNKVSSKSEFYLRQVIGSVNYTCGNEVIDFLHGYANYQIEHHLIPDLPMNHYRELQPKVKALCLKFGIPYKQENIFKRSKKLLDLMVGDTEMQVLNTKIFVHT